VAGTLEHAYRQLCDLAREVRLIETIEHLLDWDERTQLPPAGGAYRADQMAYVVGLHHRKQTDPRVGGWLSELADSPLAADPCSDSGAVIRLLQRDYDKKVRLPQKLVEELARTSVLSQQTWVEARRDNDFSRFRPHLEKIIKLKRQEAAAVGYTETPYDPLLDDFEPGEVTAHVTRVLGALREALAPLVQAIAASPRRPDVSLLAREYPLDAQEAFGRKLAAAIGFDFRGGRLDQSVHPFCAGLGPGDVRLTTRYQRHDFGDAFYSILHEAGHGIYDQGLPPEHFGLPIGQYVSSGIHESQSRLWENLVARSRPFWEHAFPLAQAAFPGALGDVKLDDFHAAINEVRPSLIRVDADEVTYNLHILVRFELELALIEGRLQAADLPGAWNEKYEHYLGVTPPSDTAGVLQDVHWSAALFGYFPSYALGNLYAAQFFAQARQDLGDLDAQFRRGDFATLREWLRTNIHQHGRRYSAAELAQRVTGQALSHGALMDHLSAKFGELYGL
jgi:carboxypeptidase Taq